MYFWKEVQFRDGPQTANCKRQHCCLQTQRAACGRGAQQPQTAAPVVFPRASGASHTARASKSHQTTTDKAQCRLQIMFQYLFPTPKATKAFARFGSRAGSSHLSGLNWSASGPHIGCRWMPCNETPQELPAGMGKCGRVIFWHEWAGLTGDHGFTENRRNGRMENGISNDIRDIIIHIGLRERTLFNSGRPPADNDDYDDDNDDESHNDMSA
uniref:SFRICE_013479 n=1 Tax=Spodoptera frugiperda TaxID=7108 RepID=A0A2H1WGV1_SPOFR